MDELNKNYLRAMDPEKLEAYKRELEMALAQTAMFLQQVNEAVEEQQ